MFEKISPKAWRGGVLIPSTPTERPKSPPPNRNQPNTEARGPWLGSPMPDLGVPSLVEQGALLPLQIPNPPRVLKASEALKNNLERSATQYGDREKQLVKEIADREAELADVRKASAAVVTALIGLEVDVED